MKQIPAISVVLLTICANFVLADAPAGSDAPDLTIDKWVSTNHPDIQNLKGKPTFLEFWATWCKPCIKNIPHLNDLYQRYSKKGLRFVALCQNNMQPNKMKEFIDNNNITYPVALDNGSADWYCIRAYPTIVLINSKGKITWRGYPWSDELTSEIEKIIDETALPLTADLEMGPFSKLEDSLNGGEDFARAYYRVMAHCDNINDTNKAKSAQRIIEHLNSEIAQKVLSTRELSISNPVKAYFKYAEIINTFGPVEPVTPAYKEWRRLSRNEKVRKQLTMNSEKN
jgi:thiol-disulfide isomerase/thioredoxin